MIIEVRYVVLWVWRCSADSPLIVYYKIKPSADIHNDRMVFNEPVTSEVEDYTSYLY